MIHSSPFPLALVAGGHWCLPSKMPSVQVECFKCFFGRLWGGLWWGELWGCGCWCWPGIPARVCWLQKMVGWEDAWWFWGCPTQVDWETQSLFEVWCYFLWLHLSVHYVFYFCNSSPSLPRVDQFQCSICEYMLYFMWSYGPSLSCPSSILPMPRYSGCFQAEGCSWADCSKVGWAPEEEGREALLGFMGSFLVGSWHWVIDGFGVITIQLSSMAFTLGPNISWGFIPLPINFLLATCLSEEWPSEEAPMLWSTGWQRQGYPNYVKVPLPFIQPCIILVNTIVLRNGYQRCLCWK